MRSYPGGEKRQRIEIKEQSDAAAEPVDGMVGRLNKQIEEQQHESGLARPAEPHWPRNVFFRHEVCAGCRACDYNSARRGFRDSKSIVPSLRLLASTM